MKATKADLHPDGRPLTQEEFINKIKTDDEFAEKWGELGPIYGKQWKSWESKKWFIDKSGIDFFRYIIYRPNSKPNQRP